MPKVALEIFGPQSYSSGWVFGGFAALVALVAIPVLIGWFTRERPTRPGTSATPADPHQARANCLARIASIRRQHASGHLSDRLAHQEISQTVRTFIATTTQWPVDRMVLSQVQARLHADPRFTSLTQWLELLYPAQFDPAVQRSVADTAAEAERLVSTWH